MDFLSIIHAGFHTVGKGRESPFPRFQTKFTSTCNNISATSLLAPPKGLNLKTFLGTAYMYMYLRPPQAACFT